MRALLSAAAFACLAACGSSDIGTTPAGPSSQGKGGSATAGAAGSSAGSSGSATAGAAGGTGGGAAGVSPAGNVRIANMNVRNLFNDKIDSGSVLDEAGSTPTTAVYQKKLGDVATVLGMVGADIIALQEVENQATLDDLAARAELGKAYPHRVLIDANDPRGIDVALLSTLPPSKTVTHKDDLFTGSTSAGKKYKYSRDVLEVHFLVGSTELVLLVVHFKAKTDDDPAKRLAEAEHTRGIADALVTSSPAVQVLVLGDFNDFPGSPPINAIQGKDPAVYTSTALTLPAGDQWTTEYNNQKLLHDDQRASPALMRLPGSAHILHDAELSSQALKDVSDHAPVVATYVIP